jgi:HK97 family phage major capsid protein
MSENLKSPTQRIAQADDPVRATKAMIEESVQRALQSESRRGQRVVDPRQDPNFRRYVDTIQSPFGAEVSQRPAASRGEGYRSLVQGILDSDEFKDWASHGGRGTSKTYRAQVFAPGEFVRIPRAQAVGFDDIREADVLASEYVEEFVAYPTTTMQLRDIMRVVPCTGPSVVYYRETGFTNAAAIVPVNIDPENATLLPPSQIEGKVVTDPIKRMGHYIAIPKSSLEDLAGLAESISDQLIPGLHDKETVQFLRGSGVGEDHLGLMRDPLCQKYRWSDGEVGDNEADAILEAMAMIRVAKLQSDGTVLHPNNHARLLKRKDLYGRYLFGDPTSSTILSQLWGRPLLVLDGQAEDIASVGAWRTGSKIRDRQEATVEFSDAIGNAKLAGMIYVIAEMRTALQHNRPEAFCEVTLDNAPISS